MPKFLNTGLDFQALMFKELLTDTSAHNPENFIYVVRGMPQLRPYGRGYFPSRVAKSSQSLITDTIARLRSPTKFFSASLVGKLDAQSAKEKLGYDGIVFQTDTCGLAGLIVEPHTDDDIWIAWNCDIGSARPSEDYFRKFASEHQGKVRSPLTLLTRADGILAIYWNELVLQGNPQIRIAGVFYPATDLQSSWGKNYGKLLAQVVSELEGKEIPLIELPSPQDRTKLSQQSGEPVKFTPVAFKEFYAPSPASLESLVT